MTLIHDNEVNKIANLNLLHDKVNFPKRTKFLNIHYSIIIHGCMSKIKVRAKFKNFRILLDSVCISTIIMGGLVRN